jgi:hypothetical protein
VGKYKVSLDRPDAMDDVLFEVPPVGLIKNKTHVVAELSDEQADLLKNAHGITIQPSSEEVTEMNTKMPGYVYPEPEEEEYVEPVVAVAEVEEEGGETS